MKKLTASVFDKISGITHGFFTREGEPAPLVTLKQIHSDKALIATKPWDGDQPEGDALVTNTAGILVAVKTADCVPVLFADKSGKVVGAAHAGWKGAIGGVLESTVAKMESLGAKKSDIVAAIGPCIGPQSYEVSDAFKVPFVAEDKLNERFFRAASRPGHLMFDLPGYVVSRLNKIGIGEIEDLKRDTLSDEATFHSYRRATLRGEKDYGRQMSVIGIAAPKG